LKARRDYTVIAVVGLDENGTWYVLDILREQWDTLDIVRNILAVQERYGPQWLSIEAGALKHAIAPVLYEAMRTTRIYVNLEEVATGNRDKMTLARPLQARMRAGAVAFDESASWYPQAYRELRRFPRDTHDDIVDALAIIGQGLSYLAPAPTLEEQFEEAYAAMTSATGESGRNPVTGY
jgi:predicted phage terminase large subunit-like protein